MRRCFIWAVLALSLGAANGGEKMRLVAHRGGAMESDENTLVAFSDAYAKGIRAFETDVRLTKDGEVVLMSDDAVNRTTNGYGPIELMTADQVKALHTRGTGNAVPFLRDLLDVFKDKPDVVFQLDVKPGSGPIYDARLEQFARSLTELTTQRLARASYRYASSDRRTLTALHRVDPQASLTYVCKQAPDKKLLPFVKSLGCSGICVLPGKTSKSFVEAAKQEGLSVSGWSVRTDDDFSQAQALGLESVLTDCPRRMLADGLGRP